ncbi:MAG TPA: Hint domain-containing protein [Candidatus Omnitrophota bacterium]|nr:Hint domain-containing protein [Candidatus Omnitrophota bacterium]HPD84470.1 Hint domain-containing protein [Candidatus Omnitrophota bacterium]HRZ03328.1 Hint domain-containing protein [Candidatus Omnitrophota bacterium]
MITCSRYKKALINIFAFLLIFGMGFCTQFPGESRASFGTKIMLSAIAYADGVSVQETTVLTDNARSIWFSYGPNGDIQFLLKLRKDANALASATNISFRTSVALKSEEDTATTTICGDQICIAPDEDATGCALDCLVCGNSICDASEDCNSCPVDCGTCSGGCFLANTPITMADGSQKPIQEVKPGDQVLSFDEKSKKIVTGTVTKLFVHNQDTDEFLIVNDHLLVTKIHPFYTEGQWKQIGEMNVGDKIIRTDLAEEAIGDIKHLKADAQLTTYNLEIEAYHNYFAGGYLVHNKPPNIQRTITCDENPYLPDCFS